MKQKGISLLLILCLLAALPTGCRLTKKEPADANAAVTDALQTAETPQVTQAPTAEPTEAPTEAPTAEPTEAPTPEPVAELGYRFADHEEAAELLLAERNYFDHLNQNDLNYRLQKLDATLPELEDYIRTQTRDYTDAEKAVIDNAMQAFLAECDARGYHLPPLEDVVFCKTTMHEESDAGAYTHGTKVFFGETVMSWATSDDPYMQQYFRFIFDHELFHCLTRNNPDFRADMYAILGFTVVDADYVFPEEIRNTIISNPDVGHHNSYAAFEIGGEMINCVVIFTTDPFEKPGDSFFNTMKTGLVPIDTLDTVYFSDEAANFWDVFGRNTDYVIDPEETLADNFGYLFAYGVQMGYATPELIEAMDEYLRTR